MKRALSYHPGITCINCKTPDIEGIHYRCSRCENYSLCEKCITTSMIIHDNHHFTGIPTVTFNPELLKTGFLVIQGSVICNQCLEKRYTGSIGTCKICGHYTTYSNDKYCTYCSLRAYACKNCGQVGKIDQL